MVGVDRCNDRGVTTAFNNAPTKVGVKEIESFKAYFRKALFN